MAKGKAQKLEKRKAREGEVPGRLDPLMDFFESKADRQLLGKFKSRWPVLFRHLKGDE